MKMRLRPALFLFLTKTISNIRKIIVRINQSETILPISNSFAYSIYFQFRLLTLCHKYYCCRVSLADVLKILVYTVITIVGSFLWQDDIVNI